MEIFNSQKNVNIEINEYSEFADKAVGVCPGAESKSTCIAFVSDEQMLALNTQFRNIQTTTDVLSFPFEPDEFDDEKNFLGDIVISAEQAAKQAAENDLSNELEIKQLILHGILHLCGFDHETDNGEMNELELKLRDKLGIS